MLHTSYIEISCSALEHNVRFIKNIIGKEVQFSSVVKGNAYGHGIELFVTLAELCGINHFSVFSADEALRVINSSKNNPTIMVMGMLDFAQLAWAIENDVEFYVFDLERLENAIQIASKTGKKAKIHIELETGMNRTGFSNKELPKVIQLIKKQSEFLSFNGLCTHFAGAESIANYFRIKNQQRIFKSLTKKFSDQELLPNQIHTSCSAAALRYPNTQLDMVRIGILQYGFFPSREVLVDYLTKKKKQDYPLRRLISWKSKIMDIKFVKPGDFVGYGTSFLANTAMKIAIVPVGYSHGFSRSLSNHGRVLICGQRVSVVGMVNMNMLSVDVTKIDAVKKGDEVVLIGNQGELEISVSSFSEFSEQINYELLTRLPSNIPRKIIP